MSQQVLWLFLVSRSAIPYSWVVIQARYSANQALIASRSTRRRDGEAASTSIARATSTRWMVSMIPIPRPVTRPWMACA